MKKKTLRNVIFISVLLIILCLLFKDSFFSIIDELSQTQMSTVVLICLCALGYNLTEGFLFTCMAKRYNPAFRYHHGIACSYYIAFYRTVTLGSGTAASAVYYLHKYDINLSSGAALSTLQYILHKIAVSFFSLIGFLCCSTFMETYFSQYKTALLTGYAITTGVCIFLIAICVSERFHKLLIYIGRRLDKNEKFQNHLEKSETQFRNLREQTKILFKDKKNFFFLLLLEMIKLGFWYIIPYFTLDSGATIFQTSSVTSLILSLAGIIPMPGGLGSTEGLFILFFSKIAGKVSALSSIVLYRFATYMFPCMIGGLCVIILHKYWSKGD